MISKQLLFGIIGGATFFAASAVAQTGTLSFYIDGQLESSHEFLPGTNDQNVWMIGSGGGFREFFDGLIDEPSIYDRALSSAEIQAIFAAGPAGKCKGQVGCAGLQPPPGLVAWWPGDGNPNDIIGGNDGLLENGTTFAPGFVADSLSFDGLNDRVKISDPIIDVRQSYTLEAWILIESLENARQPGGLYILPILNKDQRPFGGGVGFGADLGFFVTNQLGVERRLALCHILGGSPVTGDCAVRSNGQIPLGVFTHVAATFRFGDPISLLQDLMTAVTNINANNGIINSLDAKIDAALNALDDLNANNDGAAINTLQAFINSVEAQSGAQIDPDEADLLISLAQLIIDQLSAP